MRRERAWLSWEEESIESPKVVEALLAEAEQGHDDPRAEFVSQPPDEEIEALRRIAFRVGESPTVRPEARR